MRKMNKERKLLAILLVVTMLLCSFPVGVAEEGTTEMPAEEKTGEVRQETAETVLPEKETGIAEVAAESETEEDMEEEPPTEFKTGEDPAGAPAAEHEAEKGMEEESAVESKTGENPAEMPAAEPEAEEGPGEGKASVLKTAEIPAGASAAETETEKIPEEESAAENEAGEISTDSSDVEPEAKEDPADEQGPDPAGEDESEEGNLVVFDDNDAALVSDELLDEFNDPETCGTEEFSGKAEIEMINSEIHYGGNVTLVARISGTEKNYRIMWEANDGDGRGWFTVGSGDEYTFTLTPDIVNREYRVTLFAAD